MLQDRMRVPREKEEDKLLTPKQAAERLQVSMRTMYTWLRTGKVSGMKIGPRLWRVRESELN